MINESFLILELILCYVGIIWVYYFFGKVGVCCWSIFATVAMNIEVLLQVDAFGIGMTLGNVLFATTFISTDILSENYGRNVANRCVHLGIVFSMIFLLISQLWLQYIPNQYDFAMPSVKTLFTNTPRIVFASLFVYAIVQKFDVWLYHYIWKLTWRKSNNLNTGLWIRNNVATLISQLINAVMFTYVAFYGVYDNLLEIAASTFLIAVVTSILDTPVVYVCRSIWSKKIGE